MLRVVQSIILTLLVLLPTAGFAQEARPDSIAAVSPAEDCDSCKGVGKTYWIKQLMGNNFRINDPGVCYPALPRFALKVYNWGDRTFNSYDSTYVVGTGKNWKLQGKTFNWMETSMIIFPKRMGINMHSELYSDAGFSLSFMAVSIGYMWNINRLFSSTPTSRRTFNFDFTCSRFSLNYQSVSSTGGMILTKFGDFNDGHHFHYKFGSTSNVSKTLDAYWFFNYYKYSQGAAYSYSKYQLRSAGTALVGFNYTGQNISMDFSTLPAEMVEHLPLENPLFLSHYRSYNALGGYAYNWVLKPRRWILNTLAMAAVGYRELATQADNRDVSTQIANNFRINVTAVYNHRALFAALTARMNGFINYNAHMFTHFNAIVSLTGTVGMRF